MSCFKRIVCQCVMLKAVKKESFTSLHRIFLFFNKYETWDYIFSNLYETYIYMKICVPTLHPLHQSHNFIQKFPIPSERWIGWRVREHVSMYIRMRARVLILKYALNPFSLHSKNLSFQPLWESAFCKKVRKNLAWKFGGYVLKH